MSPGEFPSSGKKLEALSFLHINLAMIFWSDMSSDSLLLSGKTPSTNVPHRCCWSHFFWLHWLTKSLIEWAGVGVVGIVGMFLQEFWFRCTCLWKWAWKRRKNDDCLRLPCFPNLLSLQFTGSCFHSTAQSFNSQLYCSSLLACSPSHTSL